MATAILIGDRTGLSAELEDRLQRAGTYHVIAISGGNIAIFAATLIGLARLLRMSPRITNLLIVVILWGYAALVGGGASVARATVGENGVGDADARTVAVAEVSEELRQCVTKHAATMRHP